MKGNQDLKHCAGVSSGLATGTCTGNHDISCRLPLGATGEIIAADFLKSQGWCIENTNWRAGRYAEIDIVARDPTGMRVFVEVKTRRVRKMESGFMEAGFDAVNRLKQRKIVTSAMTYLSQHEPIESACRFDVIVVYIRSPGETGGINRDKPELMHIVEAFTA